MQFMRIRQVLDDSPRRASGDVAYIKVFLISAGHRHGHMATVHCLHEAKSTVSSSNFVQWIEDTHCLSRRLSSGPTPYATRATS